MIELAAGDLRATVAPEAGMLVTSLTAGGVELLEQRATAEQWREHATTTGVPLLYPWANRLQGSTLDVSAAKHDGNGLAKDGLPFARGPWTVRAQFPDHVRGELAWPADDPGFPYAHRVSLTHALDPEGLTVTVRVDGDGVPISFGWHPYIRIDRATDALVIPAARRHLLDDRGLPTGETTDEPARDAPLGDGEIDALFEAPAGPLRAGRVAMEILEGYPYAQVWSPPGAAFACLEPMTVPTNALVTGEHLHHGPHTAVFRLSLA